MNLKDKRIVLLGGTPGIGLAVAHKAAEEGAVVLVAPSSQSRVDRAKERLPKSAERATVDLTSCRSSSPSCRLRSPPRRSFPSPRRERRFHAGKAIHEVLPKLPTRMFVGHIEVSPAQACVHPHVRYSSD